jgi:ribosomal protein L11 methyltransferase
MGWTVRVKGYLPVDDCVEGRLLRVAQEIDHLPASAIEVDEEAGVITVDYSQVKDLQEKSRQEICTSRVGERLVIKPPWDEYLAMPGDLVVEIDPGTSFGSGLHQSTRLCLRALETRVLPGMSVVDFGTGSGILAVAAARLGASRVTAVDASSEAVEVALDNMQRNGLEAVVEVQEARSLSSITLQVDAVTANITAETIIEHSKSLAEVVKHGGLLIASGMTTRNCQEVERSLSGAGFDIADKLSDGQWVAFVAIRR